MFEDFKNHISLIGVHYSRTPLAVFAFCAKKAGEGEGGEENNEQLSIRTFEVYFKYRLSFKSASWRRRRDCSLFDIRYSRRISLRFDFSLIFKYCNLSYM
jgi:hypothetical protein